MAAYAEGLNILQDSEFYRYGMNLAEITEVWRLGSVIGPWLLDLTANPLRQDLQLDIFGRHLEKPAGETR